MPRHEWPDDVQAGDYWKITDETSDSPSNLTGTCWHVVAPTPDGDGYMVGHLVHHTVREHEDGTVSVLPGDGSSNSILITGSHGRQFHGYIRNGVWESA